MAAGGVGVPAHRSGGVVGGPVVGGEHGAAGAERDHHVAGAQAQSEGGAHVVPGSGRDQGPFGGVSHGLGGGGDPGYLQLSSEGVDQQVGAVGVLGGRPVAGAGGVAPVGGRGLARSAQAPGEPVVGEHDPACLGGEVGFVLGEPAQFGDGEAGHGHVADGVGPDPGAAELLDQVVGGSGRTPVVPEQGGADDLSLVVDHDHAVLLSRDGDGRHVVEQSGGGVGQGRPPVAGVGLGAVGVRGAAFAHHLSGGAVTDHDLAGLCRTVDSGDECHVRSVGVRKGTGRGAAGTFSHPAGLDHLMGERGSSCPRVMASINLSH